MRRRRARLCVAGVLGVVALALALALTGCAAPNAPNASDAPNTSDAEAIDGGEQKARSPEDAQTASEESPRSEAEQKLASMTLEEKVAQLFMVTLETLEDPVGSASATTSVVKDPMEATPPPEDVTRVDASIELNLQKYPVGGVILFAKNIVDPAQTKEITRALQQAAQTIPNQVPLFIAVDEEGGAVARLANNEAFGLPTYESAGSVGSSGDPAHARAMGETIGSYLKEYGFNVDFAPDADVNTNPDNPVIATRAFSSDPTTAAKMASAFAEGLRENDVIATFKHFPGHGDTKEDSHTALATTQKSASELAACEWIPFSEARDEDFVMVGHIATPQITGDDTPATLSEKLVNGTLRDRLGFEGVVVTDALNMGAITETYGAAEVAVKAIQAGCDLLLMPADFEAAYSAVCAAVQDGAISEERLDESVLRILDAKYGDSSRRE